MFEIKIISGGQSGVDRAALDFALTNDIKCGGFCPKGRLAEDGRIDEKYPLTETLSTLYQERTRLNVEQGDAMLVIYEKTLGRGTQLAIDIAKKSGKAILLAKLPSNKTLIDETILWLKKTKPLKLNIAGPRESSSKGIYIKAFAFLNEIFPHD